MILLLVMMIRMTIIKAEYLNYRNDDFIDISSFAVSFFLYIGIHNYLAADFLSLL